VIIEGLSGLSEMTENDDVEEQASQKIHLSVVLLVH
jgi:hypothetical protein